MSFFSRLGIGRTARQGSRAPARPRPARRLRVERLEGRAVPASHSAATAAELVAAMDAANLTAEADTIALVAGRTYTLTQANNATDGANGLPVVGPNGGLTILGNGCVIERGAAAGTPAFRLFDVAAGAALTLENLTLQGGLAAGAGAAASGGAIYSQGSLTLTQVVVRNNQALGSRGWDGYYTFSRGGDAVGYPATDGAAAMGGGIYVGGGSAVLTGVTLASNTAQGGNGGDGLSVYLHTRLDSGKLTVPSAGGGAGLGGGLYAAGGAVTLRNTSVTTNSALGGAAGKGKGGSAGQGVGGGLYFETDVVGLLDATTVSRFSRNRASTSDPNVAGPYSVG